MLGGDWRARLPELDGATEELTDFLSGLAARCGCVAWQNAIATHSNSLHQRSGIVFALAAELSAEPAHVATGVRRLADDRGTRCSDDLEDRGAVDRA